MNARKSTAYLNFLVKLDPRIADAVFPHGPKISRAGREYLVAQSIKGFSAEITNTGIVRKLADVQKRLVESAAKNLVADYGDDDWCPTRPHVPIPIPGPGPWLSFSDVMLNPQPLPPKELQREIGGYLVMLAEATSLQDVARDLHSIANTLLGGRSAPTKRPGVTLPQSRLHSARPIVAEAGI